MGVVGGGGVSFGKNERKKDSSTESKVRVRSERDIRDPKD